MEDKRAEALEVCKAEILKKQNELATAILLRHRQNGNMHVESFKNQVLNLGNEVKLYKELLEVLTVKKEYEQPIIDKSTDEQKEAESSAVPLRRRTVKREAGTRRA